MREKCWGVFGWLCILMMVVMTLPSAAQNPPQPTAPIAHENAPAPTCDNPGQPASAATIVMATGESLQRKRWQPEGGIIQFTIKSFNKIPDNVSFLVCFRWKIETKPSEKNTAKFVPANTERLERNDTDGTTWTVTTRIPELKEKPVGKVVESATPLISLVPLAEVQIVAVDNANRQTLAVVNTTIGITNPWLAALFALAACALVVVLLARTARLRLKGRITEANPLLQVISTKGGDASLSQAQIVLWTTVVAASAIYVMALSGDLIQITDGTLVLLGIAGTAALGAT